MLSKFYAKCHYVYEKAIVNFLYFFKYFRDCFDPNFDPNDITLID